MVYVIGYDGQPLMPTKRFGKVRHLLNSGKARVVRKMPFTIGLTYKNTAYTQPVILGVDAGSKHIGVSATTEEAELYASNVELRSDIVDLLSTRREARRARRNRKTRYRKPRFDNRVGSKNKGWLAPSVEQRIGSHLKVIEDVYHILPITQMVIETASFDIQKIKNPDISGTQYQEGEQLDFWNVREYVLWRDNHICQCCKGKSHDPVLNVHHIESRKIGGNAPNNLITLCNTCHKGYHQGTVTLPKTIKRGTTFRDAAFMGIIRWAVYNRVKSCYSNVSMTYGYITKNIRIKHGLPKEHYVDARCISGHPNASPLGYYYYQKKVRCHNRQIHKQKILIGGRRKRNQAPYEVNGYHLFDKVCYERGTYFIFGRRASGFFDIRDLSGNKVSNGSISCKKLTLIESRKTYLTERRLQVVKSAG